MFLGDIENLAGRPHGPTCNDVEAIAAAVHKTFGHLDPQCVLGSVESQWHQSGISVL